MTDAGPPSVTRPVALSFDPAEILVVVFVVVYSSSSSLVSGETYSKAIPFCTKVN